MSASTRTDQARPPQRRFRWQQLPLLGFAWIAYLLFARSTLYLIGFVGNIVVPRTIDDPGAWNATPMPIALLVNAGLILSFAAHHSVFARTGAKRWVKQVASPLIERSIYVLISSLLLILLMWQWRAIPLLVWEIHSTPLRSGLWLLFGFGWSLAFAASFTLGHSETFGVRPVLRHCQGRDFTERSVARRGVYAVVRHPMYLGFLIGVWATPAMSLGHLQLASLLTLYILIGRRWEERDLERRYGTDYRSYTQRVPALLPELSQHRD